MFHRIIILCSIGMLLFMASPSIAQLGQQDYSHLSVDEMSDAQIRQFMHQIEASGLGEENLEKMAASKGMNAVEIAKLRVRSEKLKKQDEASKRLDGNRSSYTNGRTIPEKSHDEERKTSLTKLSPEQELLRSKIFGATLFANVNPTFEPNLRMATPIDYQIGPDDEIIVDIYGFSEANYQLKVSPEGTINIPLAGIVPVSGATMEQAAARIKSRLAKIYTGIRTGATSVNVSLGNIRSIRVVLTGEVVKPGTYALPSVATVFNALYSAGGPTENGSYRTIQIIRGGIIIAVLDVYDFLLYGSLKNNVRLQDQDVIRIPVYKSRIFVNGQVKRDGIYELMSGENLSDLIRMCGDFNEKAYKARIKVLKNTETERKIEDITAEKFSSYEPSSGDQIFIDKILDRFKNRVQVKGAVFREGEYELTNGLTLTQLISKAEGLKEDAFGNRGYITRIKDDLTQEMITFNTKEIISGKSTDIPLKREDIVTIPSIFDLKESYRITIDGEVRNPGNFDYAENTTLEALIIMAGGLKEGATPKRIEISRRVKNNTAVSDTTLTAQVIYIDVDRDLKQSTGNFVLKPFDIVSVRPAPGYQIQKLVKIEGEVLFPGSYAISNKNERISDLIKRAGGLTPFAYQEGASLKRGSKKVTQSEIEQENYKLQQIQAFQKTTNDSSVLNLADVSIRNDYVGIDLPRILRNPYQKYDLLLDDGDVLHIPKLLQTVKVSGEVLSPTSVVYSSSKTFRNYVQESGGFSPKALKRHSYIIYANGGVASTKKVLFFNNYPNIKPGSEIFIPKKDEKKNRISTGEVVAISTGLATIATLIITVLR